MIIHKEEHQPIHDIFASPQRSLTQDRIKKLFIQAIKHHKRNKISLDELLQIATKMKHNNYDSLSQNLKDVIDEICSLSFVNEVLTDILFELTNNESKK